MLLEVSLLIDFWLKMCGLSTFFRPAFELFLEICTPWSYVKKGFAVGCLCGVTRDFIIKLFYIYGLKIDGDLLSAL